MTDTSSMTDRRPKTLIFHIGDCKTGSTSIQLALAQRRVALHGHSLFYPAKLAHNALAAQCINYGKATSREARQKAAVPIQKLAARVRRSDADFTVISAEVLETVKPALFQEIVAHFFADTAEEIRVVSYVRPHAARLLSSFAERTKIGIPRALAGDLNSFVAQKAADREFQYHPRFTAWRAQFGGRFLLRPMIRTELHRHSVVEDFLHHVFGGIGYEISGTDTANESLCLEDLMRLKVLQQQLQTSADLHLKLGWEFARLLATMPPPPVRSRLQLHRSLAEEIHSTYLDDARALDRDFFDGAPLMANELQHAVDAALDQPQSTEPADHLSPSELRSLDIMSRLVASLLENDEVNWPAFLHGKRVQDATAGRKAARRD